MDREKPEFLDTAARRIDAGHILDDDKEETSGLRAGNGEELGGGFHKANFEAEEQENQMERGERDVE